MDRQTARDERQRHTNDDEHHCILCDVIVEIAEHDIYFTTGRCRPCHEALEEDE